jgi:hypothetical protein
MDEKALPLTRLLLARLEKISADSFWAHRASGVRGSLLKILEKCENGDVEEIPKTKQIMEVGFFILEQAAKEKK